ncbi:hypothetical protein Y032_0192g1350 [Ancylostoma ceylanicum]|uniref:Uncharacterized protein n=1 Tax=Ancylostoma ceylanicum TaxID=53326 RepID=A0A016SPR7_9BILA|nr:hypothetical protein Y032_0192g1350 [Ancylostoma ceylanicum]
MYLKCPERASKPGSVSAKTCIPVDPIDRSGQDVFTRIWCCGGQPAKRGAYPAPAPRSGDFDPIKCGIFVTSKNSLYIIGISVEKDQVSSADPLNVKH